MTDFTANELTRIINKIPETDPTTTEYHILLQSLECFAGIADSIEEVMAQLPDDEPEDGKIIKVEFRPSPELMQQVADMAQAENEPSDEPEESFLTPGPTGAPAPETEVADVVDLVTVRAALRDAKKRGVDIKELIQSFGATNLTDLPAEKYGELMKKLEDG